MLALERRAKISHFIESNGSVRVAELSHLFGVTEETVRRDLEVLEKAGVLERTYGGAVSPRGISYEPPHLGRKASQKVEKTAMAKVLADLVNDGETLLLDASSTALYAARALRSKRSLTVLTNSLAIINELRGEPKFTVMCTGGTFRSTSLSFVGPHAERALKEYHVDKAIISCRGLDVQRGFTDSNDLEVKMKQLMMAAAKTVIAAVDSTKWGYIGFALIAPLASVQHIVTDDGVDGAQVAEVRKLGVQVHVAPVEAGKLPHDDAKIPGTRARGARKGSV